MHPCRGRQGGPAALLCPVRQVRQETQRSRLHPHPNTHTPEIPTNILLAEGGWGRESQHCLQHRDTHTRTCMFLLTLTTLTYTGVLSANAPVLTGTLVSLPGARRRSKCSEQRPFSTVQASSGFFTSKAPDT